MMHIPIPRLRTALTLALLLAAVARPATASAQDTNAPFLAAGDTPDRVRYLLGNPKGTMQLGDIQVYYYTRGTVTFRNGVVESADILSAEEARRREQQRRAQQQAAREARDARIRQGNARKNQMLSDAAFLARSPGEQLRAWRAFQSTYPEVSVRAQIAALQSAVKDNTGQDTSTEADAGQADSLAQQIAAKKAELAAAEEYHHMVAVDPNRNSTKAERRHARYEVARLRAELAKLLEQAGGTDAGGGQTSGEAP